MRYTKDSDFYVNIDYNNKLKCFTSFVVNNYSSPTIFLKIQSDTLYEYANVSLSDERIVTAINKYGKEIVLLKEPYSGDVYVRYVNYNPPEEE